MSTSPHLATTQTVLEDMTAWLRQNHATGFLKSSINVNVYTTDSWGKTHSLFYRKRRWWIGVKTQEMRYALLDSTQGQRYFGEITLDDLVYAWSCYAELRKWQFPREWQEWRDARNTALDLRDARNKAMSSTR